MKDKKKDGPPSALCNELDVRICQSKCSIIIANIMHSCNIHKISGKKANRDIRGASGQKPLQKTEEK